MNELGDQFHHVIKVGKETELEAYELLKKMCDKVVWKTKEQMNYFCDFVCYIKGQEFLIDAKSSKSNIIFLSQTKIEAHENNKYPNYYYLIKGRKGKWTCCSYLELFDLYDVRRISSVGIYLNNEIYSKFVSKPKSVQKEIRNKAVKKLEALL